MPNNMKKKAGYIIVALALMLWVVLRLVQNKNEMETRVYRFDKQAPVLVTADTVHSGMLRSERTFTGTFEPFREGKVMSEGSGKILAMPAEVGDYVKKGEIIAKVDHTLTDLQRQAVEVQIEGLRKDVERYTLLSAADAIQKVQLEKSELGLRSAEIQRSTLSEQIDRATITAPFSGIITQKFSEIGSFLNPSFPVVQITDIDRLKLTLQVPESDIARFAMNQILFVHADACPELALSGKVTLIGSRGDAAHNYPVQLEVKNTDDRRIKAGMFGSVSVTTGSGKAFPLIPANAVINSWLEPAVYVVKNGKAEFRRIEVEQHEGNQATVSGHLMDGEVVITSGFINLKNGSPVEIK